MPPAKLFVGAVTSLEAITALPCMNGPPQYAAPVKLRLRTEWPAAGLEHAPVGEMQHSDGKLDYANRRRSLIMTTDPKIYCW